MIYKQNLHTHSTFCDGKDSIFDMAEQALQKGFKSLGFSSHSFNPHYYTDALYAEKIEAYCAEIARVKELFKDKLEIYCGIEWECLFDIPLDKFEYVIGAMHWFADGDKKISFDLSNLDKFKEILDQNYSGDYLRFARKYYEEFAKFAQNPKIDKVSFIAHFDIVSKFCEKADFVDVNSKEYKKTALDCLHELNKKVPFFEVNTGGMARGYRKAPYPAPFIMKELKELNSGIIITTDCHDKTKLDYAIDDAIEYVRSFGIDTLQIFNGKEFEGIKI